MAYSLLLLGGCLVFLLGLSLLDWRGLLGDLLGDLSELGDRFLGLVSSSSLCEVFDGSQELLEADRLDVVLGELALSLRGSFLGFTRPDRPLEGVHLPLEVEFCHELQVVNRFGFHHHTALVLELSLDHVRVYIAIDVLQALGDWSMKNPVYHSIQSCLALERGLGEEIVHRRH